ncbi:hypothetical protein V1389_02015 [Flavobacterium rakeshii]|uniref:hypothetical protein n=1 Tax=Flavobacterium rakeshii TaxID=1038845 RepID=UPI002E7B4D80|nr:hypothetical protein [Flavobacterium rakeshii]MEE1897092.1 hypothetical protein [Flavobacterium rakeshii]
MNFKKPSGKTVTDTAAMTGGVLVGGMVSKAVFGLIHNPDATEDAAQQEKNESAALYKHLGLAVATGAGAFFIDGKDTLTGVAKGSLIGMSVTQLAEVIAKLAKKGGVKTESQASTAGEKALARAVGLGCSCSNLSMGLGNLIPQSYRYNLIDNNPSMGLGTSALDLSMANDPLAITPAI